MPPFCGAPWTWVLTSSECWALTVQFALSSFHHSHFDVRPATTTCFVADSFSLVGWLNVHEDQERFRRRSASGALRSTFTSKLNTLATSKTTTEGARWCYVPKRPAPHESIEPFPLHNRTQPVHALALAASAGSPTATHSVATSRYSSLHEKQCRQRRRACLFSRV